MDAGKPPGTAYQFDRFILDLGRGALFTAEGVELPLRAKSFALLRLLVENAGHLLDRDTILNAMWPDVIVGDDSITQCIRDIRRALGDEAKGLLRTVQRRGYLFAAPVSRIDPAAPAKRFVEEPNRVAHDDRPDDVNEYPLVGSASANSRSPSDQPPPLRSDLRTVPEEHPRGPEHSQPVRPAPRPVSERRNLTILVCDLPGFGERFAQLDPENLTNIIRAYRAQWAAIITGLGGHVESYTGDGMLAVFGYPEARENAAELSVRAGLAIVETVKAGHRDPEAAAHARVGIATGLMVNDPAGPELLGQITVGEPLRLAARLMAAAKPGTVVIADSTRRLVGELFSIADLATGSLADFPARAWLVTGDGVAASRFKALRGTNLMPLVGRRQELSLLVDRWEQARDGEGQVVLLSGEPGIGKSRLVQALRDRLTDAPHFYLGYYCSPDRVDSPLRPMIVQLERAAGFTRDDDASQKFARLEALLAEDGGDIPQVVPLIASLLSLPGNGRFPPLDISPRLQRELTLAALVELVACLSARRPVLLFCEDVQWADPTSIELLRLAIDRSRSLRILVLITFRPEFRPPWPGHGHVTGLTLNRLSRPQCDQLAAGLAGGTRLPMAVLDRIAARAEGIPLFVEELTKDILDSGILRDEREQFRFEGSLPPQDIPATLQDSLMARLDGLSSARKTAQIAAVIGREFSHDLLAAVIPEEEDLIESLRSLIDVGLVFHRGTTACPTYAFKHALVRDAAYACLLLGNRRELHARIALTLELKFDQVVEADPDVLAHHWTEAGVAEKAVHYRQKAGERALARSATIEAVAHLTMGRDLLQSLPGSDERRRVELDFQIALGAAMSATRGMGAMETAQAYERARELCVQLGEEQRQIPVLQGLWSSHNARAEMGAARLAAAQLLELAEQRGDHIASILAHNSLGVTLFELGEFDAARTHLQRLLEIDFPPGRVFPVPLPYDPYVSGRAWLALTLSVLGYPEQARVESEKTLADARHLAHHNSLALALTLRCSLGQYLGDHGDVGHHANALLTLAVERKFDYWSGFATYFQGWAMARAGDLPHGIGEMKRGLAICEATGAHAYVPYNLALLADMCRQANDVPLGRQLLDTAMIQLGQTDARYSEAVLHCVEGELRLASPQPDRSGAEASFRRAIESAHRQNAKTTELRAALCLARLWADGGEPRRAYELLAPVYGWFTEGFNTFPLIEAQMVIDALSSTGSVR